MDLHVSHQEHIRVFVDGDLHTEITLGNARTISDLESEVSRARHLQVLEKFLNDAIKGVGDPKYAEGLISGLKNETEEYPTPGVPPIPPNNHTTFLKGWRTGQALADVVRGIPAKKPQTPEWANPWKVMAGDA